MKKGFTLIEIMLTISVISLLSTFVFYNTTEATKKAEDAHMKAESNEVRTAIELYKFEHNGEVPSVPGVRGQMVRENKDRIGAYFDSMQILVDQGYLTEIPTSPDGESYAYMTEDSEDPVEAVFAASLNYPDSGSSTSNTCDLVTSEDAPEYACQFSTADIAGPPFLPYIAVGLNDCADVSESQWASASNQLSYGDLVATQENMYCFVNTYSNVQVACDCADGTGFALDGTPEGDRVCDYSYDNSCQIYSYLQSPDRVTIWPPIDSDYQAEYERLYEEANAPLIEEYEQCVSEGEAQIEEWESQWVCDGLEETDYCVCL